MTSPAHKDEGLLKLADNLKREVGVRRNHPTDYDEEITSWIEQAESVVRQAVSVEPADLPLAVRLRDEEGPPLPQMVAQRRAQLAHVVERADASKLGSSEPLGPRYDGTTMDNQQLHAGPGGGMTPAHNKAEVAGEAVAATDPGDAALAAACHGKLCSDCPPVGYPTDATRCETCPRRAALASPPRCEGVRGSEVQSKDAPDLYDPSYNLAWKVLWERCKQAETEVARLATVAQASWQSMDSAPRDGTPIMMTGVTAGGSRWYMDGEVYAKGWIGGSAVGRVPNYWQPLPALSLPSAEGK